MKPIETPDTNAIFVAPGCGDLPATKCHDPQTGQDYVQTVWELSLDDLKRIQETGLIYISVMGNGIQPILVSTESMLVDEGGDSVRSDDQRGQVPRNRL